MAFSRKKYKLIGQYFYTEPSQPQNVGQRLVRPGLDSMSQGIKIMGAQTRPSLIPATVPETTVSTSEASEIPDNVTAELEKLEQEGAPMVEVEGVSAILGDLADDDDELLGKHIFLRLGFYSIQPSNASSHQAF